MTVNVDNEVTLNLSVSIDDKGTMRRIGVLGKVVKRKSSLEIGVSEIRVFLNIERVNNMWTSSISYV